MNINDRLSAINDTLSIITPAWPRISLEIRAKIEEKTVRLIAENNEQIRGGIKALRELLELPAHLEAEKRQIEAALSEEDAAE